MANRGMGRMAAVITLPCISVEDGALSWDILSDEVSTRATVYVVAHPEALLAPLADQNTDDRGTIIGIGAVPPAFIHAPAWRIRRVTMRHALFPPHSDTVRPPQRRSRSSRSSVQYRSDWLGCSDAAPRAWPVVAASFRRPFPSATSSHPRMSDTGSPESALGRGTDADWRPHSADIRAPGVEVPFSPEVQMRSSISSAIGKSIVP
jgi:hypothetical protein